MAEVAPLTLEGWYALHQVFTVDWSAARMRTDVAATVRAALEEVVRPPDAGWSGLFRLVGGGADLMVVHFREALDSLGEAGLCLRRSPAGALFRHEREYVSITEAGLYHATADAAAQATPGSPEYRQLLEDAAAIERESDHIKSRLYPQIPDGMRYVSFYPMSKRRIRKDNWYMLSVKERSRLMREHGLVARTFAGRVFQVITGSLGLDDWEWGVTLFARDPLEFKRIVTELRYDEASARYSEFGTFHTGVHVTPAEVAVLFEFSE